MRSVWSVNSQLEMDSNYYSIYLQSLLFINVLIYNIYNEANFNKLALYFILYILYRDNEKAIYFALNQIYSYIARGGC